MKVTLQDGTVLAVWFRYHRSEDKRITSTTAHVSTGESEPVYSGEATTAPQEQPSRVIGRKVALARALKSAGFDDERRREIWAGLASKGLRLLINKKTGKGNK